MYNYILLLILYMICYDIITYNIVLYYLTLYYVGARGVTVTDLAYCLEMLRGAVAANDFAEAEGGGSLIEVVRAK